MIRGITALLGFWFVGEAVVALTHVPVPGAVLGLLLLFGWLQWRGARALSGAASGSEPASIRAGDALLKHLQLLFVPAGVGVIAYAAQMREHALPLAVGFVASWLTVIVAVGWFVQLLAKDPPDPTLVEGESRG